MGLTDKQLNAAARDEIMELKMAHLPKTERTHSITTTSVRGAEWMDFAAEVASHIEAYTVPQYGDKGADQATEYTADDCVVQCKKYLNRYGRNARPGQERLDMLKTAHYLQLAADKMSEHEGDCP
jgi:hypothetical protein